MHSASSRKKSTRHVQQSHHSIQHPSIAIFPFLSFSAVKQVVTWSTLNEPPRQTDSVASSSQPIQRSHRSQNHLPERKFGKWTRLRRGHFGAMKL
ncbi:hypothetical protein PEX1_003300 [Penicillium expansum]|uniref:Uncharacterized protein n=1 Tax=Penicillium expansum TaxID=27334 RepID=A0A0A2JV44_PENEN|nr:hypothetical protein PEX2_072820 [Penicillium expansum]KGO36005.1 hypothetical protein PEXP_075240 [Penicillium expansum]KGO48792.1 hypothetical protein PEX1_003300 [Penicillium expansum]KGO59327.1 hypothetical protein PEX2_072820 [Penicillium expansum]